MSPHSRAHLFIVAVSTPTAAIAGGGTAERQLHPTRGSGGSWGQIYTFDI